MRSESGEEEDDSDVAAASAALDSLALGLDSDGEELGELGPAGFDPENPEHMARLVVLHEDEVESERETENSVEGRVKTVLGEAAAEAARGAQLRQRLSAIALPGLAVEPEVPRAGADQDQDKTE